MKALKHILWTLAILAAIPAFAQKETIRMKDGTEYTGYIARQNYADGTGEIAYSRVVKTIPLEDILSRQTENREVEKLSPEWLAWAKENGKLETLRDISYLPVTILAVKGDSTREYYILLNGSRSLQAFSISDGVAAIKMSDIEYVQKPERCSALLTDIDDVVQTELATFTGIIREQRPGELITVWNRADRSLHAIDYADIRSVGKAAFNPDYPIWEQSACLERLYFKKGGATEPGLVMENGFGEDINLLFAVPAGSGMDLRQYKYEDITAVEKIPNPGYKPRYDIILAEGEARVNRDSTLVAADILPLEQDGILRFFYLNPEKPEAVAQVADAKVCIETHMAGLADIYVARAQEVTLPESAFKALAAGAKPGKVKKDEPEVTLMTYTYQSLMESEVEIERSVSINGTVKLEFTLPEPGLWFVYIRKQKLCWALQLPEPVIDFTL